MKFSLSMAAPYKRKCWIHRFMEVINPGSFLQSQFTALNSVHFYHMWRWLWHSCRWLDESLIYVCWLYTYEAGEKAKVFCYFPGQNITCVANSIHALAIANWTVKTFLSFFFLTFQQLNWICRATKMQKFQSKNRTRMRVIGIFCIFGISFSEY